MTVELKNKELKKITIFVSSPGDVENERARVKEAAARLNRMINNSLAVVLEVLDWKTHIVPDMGRPQGVINDQLGDYDIFVGILWKRFGTPTGKTESGTEEEFNNAFENWRKHGRPRILFYFNQTPYTPKDMSEMKQWTKVMEFKEKFWKEQKGLVMEYENAEAFSNLLGEHLFKLLQEWFPPKYGTDRAPITDFTAYLKYLKQETMHIDIRGLVTGKGKIHQFPIEELYIPLRTRYGLRPASNLVKERFNEGDQLLEEALKSEKLFIKGDPGSGKTTFLRLIANKLCRRLLGDSTGSMGLFTEYNPLPLLIRLGSLSRYISTCKDRPGFPCPVETDSPKWLLHYLEDLSDEFNWKVTGEMLEKELKEGRCLIMLDGLDEAPDRHVRLYLSRLAENLLRAWPKCRLAMTSRPAALADGDVAPGEFEMVEIAPLDGRGKEEFLNRWCAILYGEAPNKGREYKKELKEALDHRQISIMAKTPVMLTALAVVHWNENRLPEQRAELYESVLTWLFRSREDKEGRIKAERCRKLLQKLALAMFTHEGGRQKQVGIRWAGERIAGEFKEVVETERIENAEEFLQREMVDSGVIVERELRVEFWHLSFQEYLAAYEIGGISDDNQEKVLFHEESLYRSEWREVVMLLGGVLYKQGDERINNLIDRIIERAPKERGNEKLAEKAKVCALLGGVVQDLSPYNYEPLNPEYREIIKSVMGIFDKEVFRSIPVKIREEAADALGRVGDPRFDREKELWVRIRGGKFWMGAQREDPKGRNYDGDADTIWDESPVHEVSLSEYWIGKYPVTVNQYKGFMDGGGYEEEKYWKFGGFGEYKEPENWQEQLGHPTRPVVSVSWYEAKAYAEWAGKRLATEAEWERAARGPGEEYRKWPWGDKEPDKETMNYGGNVGHATPVEIFPESISPEGVIDMAGNVWEWVEDCYGDYQSGSTVDPIGPEEGSFRVIRGGGWLYDASYCRSANRSGGEPGDRDGFLGFRLAFSRS